MHDAAGNASTGLGVNTDTCEPIATGLSEVCTVWEDPDYDADQNAFYYARLIETPSCRWSTLQCQAAGVNPFAEDCPVQKDAANARALAAGATGPVYDNCCAPLIQKRFTHQSYRSGRGARLFGSRLVSEM